VASRPSPAFRRLVLRAWRRQADRAILASTAFAACGAAYLGMSSTRDWFGWAMIGLGALGVILGMALRGQAARLPRVRKLFEQPQRVVRVANPPSGDPGSLRLIFDDGDELVVALSEREARLFASHVAAWCKHAEIALPWMQRPAARA
jgi:hypothetical protein